MLFDGFINEVFLVVLILYIVKLIELIVGFYVFGNYLLIYVVYYGYGWINNVLVGVGFYYVVYKRMVNFNNIVGDCM